MRRILIIFILSLILLVVFAQIYLVLKERGQLRGELADLNTKLDSLVKENNNLQSEITYFSYPENLEKELKSNFNYKNPGEQMIIIVP